jgi:hypothetical protein
MLTQHDKQRHNQERPASPWHALEVKAAADGQGPPDRSVTVIVMFGKFSCSPGMHALGE